MINLNNTLKYPNGKVFKKNSCITQNTNNKKAHLGIDFEESINESNTYYLNNNIASIYKKPTPIQVVKVDYPSRNKAKIVEAYYKIPSTTDYNGIYKGLYIDFETKSCNSNSFPFSHIYNHQITHLDKVHQMGGISFLLIEFSSKKEIYLLPTPHLVKLYKQSLNGGRKSISYEYFKENAYLIQYEYKPIINYLKAVDLYITTIKKS